MFCSGGELLIAASIKLPIHGISVLIYNIFGSLSAILTIAAETSGATQIFFHRIAASQSNTALVPMFDIVLVFVVIHDNIDPIVFPKSRTCPAQVALFIFLMIIYNKTYI
jgi:hypothetical protein